MCHTWPVSHLSLFLTTDGHWHLALTVSLPLHLVWRAVVHYPNRNTRGMLPHTISIMNLSSSCSRLKHMLCSSCRGLAPTAMLSEGSFRFRWCPIQKCAFADLCLSKIGDWQATRLSTSQLQQKISKS
jgi:hypothetical protein